MDEKQKDISIERIKDIVLEIIGDSNFNGTITEETNLIESELLDSMGIIMLITQLEESFSLSPIDVDDIIPDNFSSIKHIKGFVDRIVG